MYARIEELNWGEVPGSLHPFEAGPDPVYFAFWPGPVNHDQCFEEAGYDRFGDPDEEWEAEFRTISRDLFDRLVEACGEARVRVGLAPPPIPRRTVLDRLLRRRPETPADPSNQPPLEQLLLAALNEVLPPVIVDLGDPPGTAISACAGHAFYLLGAPRERAPDLGAIVDSIRRNLPVTKRELDWKELVGWWKLPDAAGVKGAP